MASNLARRLDRLERLAHDLLSARAGPVYLREGAEVPQDVDPDRVITIKRIYLDPPEQPAEKLPEIVESSPAIERAAPPSFHRKRSAMQQAPRHEGQSGAVPKALHCQQTGNRRNQPKKSVTSKTPLCPTRSTPLQGLSPRPTRPTRPSQKGSTGLSVSTSTTRLLALDVVRGLSSQPPHRRCRLDWARRVREACPQGDRAGPHCPEGYWPVAVGGELALLSMHLRCSESQRQPLGAQ